MRAIAPCLLALAAQAPDRKPAPEIPFELRVDHAVARGIAHLQSIQQSELGWSGYEGQHPGGATALVCYTLLESGVRRGDDSVRMGLAALEGVRMQSTYSAAVHLLMLDQLHAPGSKPPEAQPSLAVLLAAQKAGLWSYPWGPADMSNTQFALLGLRAAKRLGLEVPSEVLRNCAAAIWPWHEVGGGFHYRSGNEDTGGMTAATLAGLEVLREFAKTDAALGRALAGFESERREAERWFERRYSIERPPYGSRAWTPNFQYAYLWALERYCGLAGREKIGSHDWYREGAEWLMARQSAAGDWGPHLPDTCFALLFLRRATVTGIEQLAQVHAELDEAKRDVPPPLVPDAGAPLVTDWWLAGPWTVPTDEPFASQAPFDPRRVELKKGGRVGNRALERVALQEENWTDLDRLTSRGGDHQVWLLGAALEWTPLEGRPAAPFGALLWLRVEDAWSVWLDGKPVAQDLRMQAPIEESVSVALSLAPGAHELVVLVHDELGTAPFSARVTDAAGRAPPSGFSAGAR